MDVHSKETEAETGVEMAEVKLCRNFMEVMNVRLVHGPGLS